MSESTLRQRAYEHIQRKILSGELQAGQVVSEQSLASEIGMSRTPVREAIRNLEQEGVLEQVPRFGTIVRKLERIDLEELYELREALEPFAVGQAAGKLGPEDVATLQKLCDEIKLASQELGQASHAVLNVIQMRRLLSADLGFHLILLRAAGNRRMLKIVADSRLLTGIFGVQRLEHDRTVLEETYRHHTAILRAVERGETEAARLLMAEHIRTSRIRSLEYYDRHSAARDLRTIPLGLPADLLQELDRIGGSATAAIKSEPAPAKRPRRKADSRKG